MNARVADPGWRFTKRTPTAGEVPDPLELPRIAGPDHEAELPAEDVDHDQGPAREGPGEVAEVGLAGGGRGVGVRGDVRPALAERQETAAAPERRAEEERLTGLVPEGIGEELERRDRRSRRGASCPAGATRGAAAATSPAPVRPRALDSIHSSRRWAGNSHFPVTRLAGIPPRWASR